MKHPEVACDGRTFAIIGAAIEVHRILRPGYSESIYTSALAVEFEIRGISFEAEVAGAVEYEGRRLRGLHRADFVCFGEVVVEVKARSVTGAADEAQLLNYLAVGGYRRGLLLNFGTPKLSYRRFVMGPRAAGHG